MAYVPRRKGSTLVFLAAGLTALIGMAGVVIDFGNAAWQRTRLQALMDAAALAGGQDLPDTALAGSIARQYVQKNGEDNAPVSVSYSKANTRITVTKSKAVPTYFMRIVGVPSVQVAASATGELRGPGGAFDYAIFSGSQSTDLPLNGSTYRVLGAVHTNKNLIVNGSDWLITKAAEAVGTVTKNGSNMTIGSLDPRSPFVPMLDYSGPVAAAAAATNDVCTTNHTMNGSDFTMASMYVKGNVITNGSGFSSTGVILADGNIIVNGSGILVAGSNQVCFYSKNGDVTVNGSALTVDRDNNEIIALKGRHVKLVASTS